MARILVVDDEEHIRLLYTEELKEQGYEVLTAESGFRLLDRVNDEHPSLVILDIRLVQESGLDLLGLLRDRFYDLPVILVTAYDTFKEDLRVAAADHYVVKGFDLTELLFLVNRALEAHESLRLA